VCVTFHHKPSVLCPITPSFNRPYPLPWRHNRTSYHSEQIWGSSISRHTQQILHDLSADRKVMLHRNLTQNAFCIVSADNIDLLQSYAQVYATDSHRSYHGTSIHCVEPMPTTRYECTSLRNRHRKKVHALTPGRSPSALMETPKCMRILPTAWIEQPLCVSAHSALLNVQMTRPMNLLEKGSDRSTSLSLSAAECRVTADSLLLDLSTSLPPSTAKYNRGWIFKPKAVNAVRVTHCAIPRGWHCGCTQYNHRQCGPAYKCSLTRKSAAARASHLVKQLYK